MRVDDFDFEFDERLIALRPARPRDAARLLSVPAGPADAPLGDAHVRDLPDLLRAGDVLVVNDTRVIAAALSGERARDGAVARISVNLLEAIDGSRWRALARPARRLRVGDTVRFGAVARTCERGSLAARVAERGEDGLVVLDFEIASPDLDMWIEEIGNAPLPPYIAGRRAPDEADRDDYQTMFAARDGAVAAPTAGLHFTAGLRDRLAGAGMEFREVTLHVGAGTFLPVRVGDTQDHRMHAEWGRVSGETADALNAARAGGRRIVAVGTTSLRLLESAVDETGRFHPFDGSTDIFITPGFTFRAVDVLVTNFHLPRSTLFMLVSAFSGLERMKRAYAHAVASGYRFYSYGDACLLERAV